MGGGRWACRTGERGQVKSLSPSPPSIDPFVTHTCLCHYTHTTITALALHTAVVAAVAPTAAPPPVAASAARAGGPANEVMFRYIIVKTLEIRAIMLPSSLHPLLAAPHGATTLLPSDTLLDRKGLCKAVLRGQDIGGGGSH